MNRRLLIFALFTASYFLSYFFRTANAVIAPDLAAEMDLTAGQLGLMTSLFFASFAVVQLPLGVCLDRWGARWVTPGLMLVGAAGSLLFGLAPSFAWLGVGRALIGVGMAGVLMGSLKIFSQWFSAGRYATVSGLLVGIGSLGAVGASTPLAWLNGLFGWRAVFLIGAVVTAVIALATMAGARNRPVEAEPAAAAEMGGRLADVFRDGQFWRLAPLTFFLAGTILSVQALWAGPYLFDVLGLSSIAAGNVLLALALGATTGYLLSGWLADRFGLPRVIVAASAVFVLCQFGLALRPPLAGVALLYAFFGFTGAFNVMLLAQARQIFPLQMTGKAVTAVNLFAIGGTFLLQWWLGWLIDRWPADAAGHYPPEAYAVGLACTGVAGALALIWYLPLARQR